MAIHNLKTWIKPFTAVLDGIKTHEVRINDRDFQVGDTLILEEYDPERCIYTGRTVSVIVTYISLGNTFGLPENLCVMSIIKDRRKK